MNKLVRTFIEFMDCAALEDEIKAGRSVGLSLRHVQGLKLSALRQLETLQDEAERFDNRHYSQAIQNIVIQAPEHPDKRAAMMTLFHEYCRFQCALKLLDDEPLLSDLLQERGLEALTELESDSNLLRPYGEELVSVFEKIVASGAPCTGSEYRELVEIISCASILYDIDLSDEVIRVVNHHSGEEGEDSNPSGLPPVLQ